MISEVGRDAGVDASSVAAIKKARVAKLKMRTKKVALLLCRF